MIRFDWSIIEAMVLAIVVIVTPFALYVLLPGKKSPDLRGPRTFLIILLSLIIYCLVTNMIFSNFHQSLVWIIMILIGAAIFLALYFLLPGKRTSGLRAIIVIFLSGIVDASFPFISSSAEVRMWAPIMAVSLFFGGLFIALITFILYTLIIDRNKKIPASKEAEKPKNAGKDAL